MKKLFISIIALTSTLLASCVKESFTDGYSNSIDLPINISATYPVSGSQTRATDNGFVAEDEIGIFVVDYNEDGSPGELASIGVRAANVPFVFDGYLWTSPYQIYWGRSTPSDIYGYYPYDSGLNTPTAYSFTVSSFQDAVDVNTTSGAGYERSDLLWAKAEKVYPTTEVINLRYKHLMAGVTISLEKGSGFTDVEWGNATKRVVIGNTKLSGTVNLQDGSVEVVDNTVKNITPLAYNDVWRAVVMPQTVEAGEPLIIVEVDGQSYSLIKDESMTYNSGKMHNFTLLVNKKTATGDYEFQELASDVTPWFDDPDLHDGIVRQYIVVDVQTPGTLASVLDGMGYKYKNITALKVTGFINYDDLVFMGTELTSLEALNLRDVKIEAKKTAWGYIQEEEDTIGGFGYNLDSDDNNNDDAHGPLKFLILPSSLKKIDSQAFLSQSLMGMIEIPDGVEYIGGGAFAYNYLSGSIKLPSSLKILDTGAFYGNTAISGQLYLPEGLEAIGNSEENYGSFRGIFEGTHLTGPLILPSSLVRVTTQLGFTGTTGTVTIPPKLTYVPWDLMSNSGCTAVEFHDGIIEINENAFANSSLSGELVLPPNLKYIAGRAFAGTKISSIIFPESLTMLDLEIGLLGGIFEHCIYLTGVLELPKNVAVIPQRCFRGCSSITGLVIPENVEIIKQQAFAGCSSIGSIVCKATEPPVLAEDAFYGVSMDNFTLEVPKGCVEAYRRAPGWSKFKRIAEQSNFVCQPQKVSALNTSHVESIILYAEGDWSVEYCPSWITLSRTSGNGKNEINLIFSELPHGSDNREDSIIFVSSEDKEQKISCTVSQYDYQYDEDSYLTLQSHTKGKGVNIVFVGDGYDAKSISEGEYLNLVKEQVEYFFGVEPYRSHRDYFNVYVTFPLSQECGVNTMNTYVNNRFGTLYGYDGTLCTKNQLITAVDEVFEYVIENSPISADVINKSLVILVPNSDAYDGSTLYAGSYNRWRTLSICPPSSRPYPQDTRGVIQHEAGGHGFGKLADESILASRWVSPAEKREIEEFQQDRGWYQNVSLTSNYTDVPWADFIFDPRYSDYVDIYEGGYNVMRGVFRPESNSCMNYGIPYYNVMSRLDIMRRILNYADVHFTMDYFYANDSTEWGDLDGTTRNGATYAYFTGTAYGASNTHLPPRVCDAKSLGDAVRAIRKELKSR